METKNTRAVHPALEIGVNQEKTVTTIQLSEDRMWSGQTRV
jgi:hypothetical protein